MAKDPAFLFYSSDFLVGTMMMTNSEIGAYIKLLCYQHQNGHIPNSVMQSLCGGIANALVLSKFKLDNKGLFFNERLDNEILKRKKHSEKQKENALMRWHKSGNANAMPLVNENVNENIIDNVIKEGVIGETNQVSKIPPEFKYVQEYFNIKGHPEESERFYDYYTSNGWRVGKNKMKDWKATVRNWLKNKNEYKNNGSNTENTEPKFGRIPISELRDYATNPAPLRFERDNPLE